MSKYTDSTGLLRVLTKLKTKLDEKAETTHTHDRVNGLKPVVSNTIPTTSDGTIITFVKSS